VTSVVATLAVILPCRPKRRRKCRVFVEFAMLSVNIVWFHKRFFGQVLTNPVWDPLRVVNRLSRWTIKSSCDKSTTPRASVSFEHKASASQRNKENECKGNTEKPSRWMAEGTEAHQRKPAVPFDACVPIRHHRFRNDAGGQVRGRNECSW
jgi:hypothetical protein